RIYDERDIGAHVRALIPQFSRRLERLADRPLVGEVRCAGLVGAVELVADKAVKRNFDAQRKVGPWTMNKALEHGLIVRAVVNDTIALCPPLIISAAELDDMFDRLERTLDDAAKEFGRA
ncbi:MAG: aminotransferase class III-fold pyridoxal phosphate-dependent enzyme, partial [Rhodoplanes sp.]